jgi:apolipoprotein N-acyltransferase
VARTAAAPPDDTVGIAARAAGLNGWRRRLIAMLAGVAAAAALPPVHALPLLVPAFCLLVWMLSGQQSRRAAFFLGFWFGFGHHVAGLYWLAWPMTLDLARFGWMIPFAVFGMAALLGVFSGAATLAAHMTGSRGLRQVIYLAVAWAGLEWLRGFLFTGFPWNLLATSWVAFDLPIQATSLLGPYGLGMVTVLIAALPATLWMSLPGRRLGGIISIGLLASLFAFGWARLPAGDTGVLRDVRLRLVQGHVPQALKWARDERERFFNLYINLSRRPGFERITHVIWPETAVHFRFQTGIRSLLIGGPRLAQLLGAVPKDGYLIAGTIRDDGQRAWNSVQAIDGKGKLLATYDKHHLVPFGEYVPLRSVLSWLGVERLAHGRFDFSFGAGPRTLKIPGAPAFSPLVCYEAIFPHEAVGAKRPGWLLNVTNDAWFGTTSGPYQHLAAARLRAVEQGLPLVRVANTGISVVTDAYGRVTARLGLGKRGIIDTWLPVALERPPIYGWLGDWVLLILSVLAALLAQITRRLVPTV